MIIWKIKQEIEGGGLQINNETFKTLNMFFRLAGDLYMFYQEVCTRGEMKFFHEKNVEFFNRIGVVLAKETEENESSEVIAGWF